MEAPEHQRHLGNRRVDQVSSQPQQRALCKLQRVDHTSHRGAFASASGATAAMPPRDVPDTEISTDYRGDFHSAIPGSCPSVKLDVIQGEEKGSKDYSGK